MVRERLGRRIREKRSANLTLRRNFALTDGKGADS